MNRKPNIICAGMLDTKGDEIRYLAKQVEARGGNPLIMDVSLGHETDWADITLRESLSMTGNSPEDVFILARAAAIDIVAKAGTAKILELYQKGMVDGIIGWAGGIGTTVVTHLMRALPLGLPKVMMATGASGNTRRWLGVSDIYISNPISEKGINKLTKMTVNNGVCSVVAMAKEWVEQKEQERKYGKEPERPMAAVTLYGTTTAAAMRCDDHMKKKGWDTLYFHQVGSGAAMEDLIRSGDIKAVFDLTPGEITNNYFQSQTRNPESWTGVRFTAAFDTGIPIVAAPGGVDESPFGMWQILPEEYKKEFAEGKRQTYRDTGMPYYHNSSMIIIPTTLQENKKFSQIIASRLNRAKGPALFLLPLKGWSAYDQSSFHASKEMGWAEDGNGPVWMPDDRNPEWSKRATQMWEILRQQVDLQNPNLDVIVCDLHILDPEFAELACSAMDRMLDGTWKKGLFRNLRYVLWGIEAERKKAPEYSLKLDGGQPGL